MLFKHEKSDFFSINAYRFRALLQHFIISILILKAFSLYANDLPVHFEHLTAADGLSQNAVYTILEDNQGFMWFGTRLGLNRYDGKEFKVFSYNPMDKKSLPGYKISALCVDQDDILWVGTSSGGLSKYISSLEQFENFQYDPDDPNSLPGNNITALFSDSRGRLWIGTEQGLSLYDKASHTFTNFYHDEEDPNSISQNRILSFAEYPAGSLWVGTENGSLMQISMDDYSIVLYLRPRPRTSVSLNCILPDTSNNSLWIGRFGDGIRKIDLTAQKLRYFGAGKDNIDYILTGPMSISQTKQGTLWIGTVAGLVSYDTKTEKFQLYVPDENDGTSISDDIILSTYVDSRDNLWIGSDSGIDMYDPGLVRFRQLRNQTGFANSIPANNIFTISKDGQNNIWIGTTVGGVSVIDTRSGEYTHYAGQSPTPGWSMDYISRLRSDLSNTIYIGTFSCGLFTLDVPTQTFQHYRNDEKIPSSFNGKTTKDILVARDQSVWIATEFKGLDRFDKLVGNFEHFQHDPENPGSINSNSTYSLLEDHAGYIWVGTADKGLNRLDRSSGVFTHFEVEVDAESSISSNCVLSLFEDNNNNLWIGTRNGGLNKLGPDRQNFSTLDLDAPPSDMTIYAILQDDQEYLWLSTNGGLMKAHPDSGLVNRYTKSDGVQESFYFNSSLKVDEGEMYFGGTDGINVFHPDSIRNNPFIPPVVITALAINYEPVTIGENEQGRSILDRSITQKEELNLLYSDKVISFKFAALNFSASYKNHYSYKLEGYDEAWIDAGHNSVAQYMNIPAGRYIFRVRGSNNDDVWNLEGASIVVNIAPPFWKTWWFKLLTIVTLIGFILSYIQLSISRLKSQRSELEALVRERSEQLKQEIEGRQKVELEKSELKLDHLKRELLTQSLHLNDKQQIMDNLQTELETLTTLRLEEIKLRLRKLLRFLKDRSSVKRGWEEFELWFTEIHTGFYTNLRQAHSELSESELKVCALLRLNLISKDIAKVMNVQSSSIDIYRHRIRKKLGIEGEENLSTFLSKY
ncbi:MAG: hypothetical protein HQ508_06360 [Candidatus Marinimicrobia bacterium]|nr:hypothetical protein [Candidatus Neomarinimicrobiota bacterium]